MSTKLIGPLALLLFMVAPLQAQAGDAQVRYVITNGGVDVKDKGAVHFHKGNRDGDTITWAVSGQVQTVPTGTYAVDVTFSDGAVNKEIWLDNQTLSGTVNKTVEMGVKIADVTYTITNNGVDAKDKGQVHFHQGNREGDTITWAISGQTSRVPAGTYSVQVTYGDGSASKEIWLDNQTFSGKVARTVEAGVKTTDVTYVITNGGVDAKDKGQVHYRLGNRDGNEITWAISGQTSRLPEGIYSVHVTYSDGSASKEEWFDNQTFAGKVSRTVEVGVQTADVTYLITNGGADAKDKGQVHFRQGSRDGNEITWAISGQTSRLPAGTYSVHVTYSDGMASKEMWFDNQTFSGKVSRTVEVGVKTADVTYVITNGGTDVKDKGQVHFRQGGRDGNEITWAISGQTTRLLAGIYAVEVRFDDGFIHKTSWLDAQNFSGAVRRTVSLNIAEAQPTVSVTENGADVGDKASVDFFEPASDNDVGATRSSETALLEQGTYDIRATMADAEGWLRKVPVSGKQHLTIAVKKTTIQTLQSGAPPPKACRIEVYGVNFDFNKAVLRPDSDPVLNQVLALFTTTPSFSAEVSGHTDNIGTPSYNLKLSQFRAEAVKTWLVAHGVPAGRVTSRGYGDTQPLLPNTTDDNRFKNRRVELRRMNCT